jgi:S-adenosylmethionine hydrolase
MGRRFEVVSFLSDAGYVDEYAGVIRAVIHEIAPHVTVIDVTHGIAPFDVRGASLALARAVPYLPSGVVLAVVDPGVGTGRRAVAIEVAGGDGVIVGPDNGLLAPAVAMAGGATKAVLLTNVEHHVPSAGRTSAGRDIFGPAAAALCNGVGLDDLGDEVDPGELLPGLIPLPRDEQGRLACEVLWVDRYGNCQLNAGPDDVASFGNGLEAVAGDTRRAVTRVETFGELAPGAVGFLVDGSGMIALVLDRRSAAEELGLAAGDAVTLGPLSGDETPRGATSPVALSPR